MAYASNTPANAATFGRRLTDIRTSAASAYGNWRVYRNTMTELNALTSRELGDLGINHSMVKRIALEAAYGKSI